MILQTLKDSRPSSPYAMTSPSMMLSLGKCLEGSRDRGETLGEVFAVAREESDPAVGLQTERAIAVELQLVRPSRPFRQFGNRQGEHRLDESDLSFRDTHDSSVVVVFKCRTQPTAPDRRSGLPIRSVRNLVTESNVFRVLGLDLDCSTISQRLEHLIALSFENVPQRLEPLRHRLF